MTWREVSLKQICDVDWGNTKLTKSSYVDNGKFLAVSAAGSDGLINHYEHEANVAVLSAIGAQCGRMFFPGERFTAIKNTITLTPKVDLSDGKFLYYLLTFVELPQRGAGQPFISKGDIEAFRVLIPESLQEQREIVEKLDSAFAEIDLLQDINSKSSKDLLASLFDTYRDTLLSTVCADSAAVEFGRIGNFVRGPFGGSLKKSIFKPSGIAVYEQQHAIYDNFESFRYFIDDTKYQEMKRFEVKTNDLIMSCSGTYGKIAVVPEGSPKGIINQALLKITPDKGVRSQFIKHWMQSSLFQLELAKDIGGAALQNVPSVAKMKSIKIRLPEEKIQIETIKKLDEFQAEIELAETVQERIRINYVDLRQSFLSSAFSLEEIVV